MEGETMNEKQKAQIILEEVCKSFQEEMADVTSKSRRRELADCRKAFSYVARRVTRCSFTTLGGMIGKDHSTILCASTSAVDLMRYNGYAKDFELIEKRARMRIVKEREIVEINNFGQI